MKHLILAFMLTCLAAAAWACGGDSAAPEEAQAASKASSTSPADDGSEGERSPSPQGDSGGGEPVERSSPDGDGADGGHSSASSGDDDPAGHANGDDDGGSSSDGDPAGHHDGEDDDGADSGYSSSSEDDDAAGHASGDDDGGAGGYTSSSGDDDVVSYENPGFIGVPFDGSRNDALAGAQPLDVVTWTVEPTASFGALEAEGVLGDGATLFNPMVDGEGAGFIVYFKGVPEPLVLLLPDLGSLHIWETDDTVAPTELEIEGGSFTIRAYSPLFMDIGPGDLEIRLFGYDGNGADALLGVRPVEVAGPGP